MFKFPFTFSPFTTDLSKRWEKIVTLRSARAYAASITLTDGRIWILGGLGVDSVLKTTEILAETSTGGWKSHKGPNLPKALFGHCIEHLQHGRLLLTGGFDGSDQTDTSEEFEWNDELSGKWFSKPWSAMTTKRYDHACYSVGGIVHVTGGWNEDITQKLITERYNPTRMNWEKADFDFNDRPILRSAIVGVSEGKLALIGGVSCEVGNDLRNGNRCTKHKEGYTLELNDSKQPEWKNTTHVIVVSRSSHTGVVVPTSIDFACKVE